MAYKKKINSKLFFRVLLSLIIIFNVVSTVWAQKEKYFSYNYWKNYPTLEKIYNNSIYRNKHGSFPRDEVVYSYAAGALIKGVSPIIVNPEVPPLGKYIISLSILIFNNPNTVIIFFASTSLYLMYLLSNQILKNKTLSLIAPFFLSFESMFKNQLIYTPLLDIIQLAFLLSVFYFFNKSRKSKNMFDIFLSVMFLGFFISTKFFGTGITVVIALLFPLFVHKEWKLLKQYIFVMPLSIFILYSTYLKVLIDGYPLNRFLGIQKWVFLYNKGHLRQAFSIWPLLLLNKWYTQGKISYDPYWLITWPATTIISFSTLIIDLFRKTIRQETEILFVWIFFYFILMSFADASSRYFVILIPVLYIISVYGIVEFISWRFSKFKNLL